MKVLNVCALIDPVIGGGTGERTYRMSKYLAQNGVECAVLSLNIGKTEARLQELAQFGVRGIVIPSLYDRYYIPGLALKKIRQAVMDSDIVHLMGHWDPLNALTYLYVRQMNKPYVVCPAGALIIYGRSKLLKRMYNALIGYSMIRNTNCLIAVTPAEMQQFKAYGITDHDRTVVIPNGVDPDDYSTNLLDDYFRRHVGLGTAPYILFMGRLDPIKGPDLLIKAFEAIRIQYPQYHLVLAGPDNGMLSELKAFVIQHNLSNVHFVGFVAGDLKVSALREADLVVIPSRHEAMSIVVLEAGVAGTPVLITDQCGFDEVQAIKGGKVVPVTVEALTQGLASLLAYPDRLKAMGRNLYYFTLENYSWHALIQRYVNLYQNIIGCSAG